tara:strand:+ start:4466 stop:4963 length:498 start_codon:yes stop_codon:yes gene_type:complete
MAQTVVAGLMIGSAVMSASASYNAGKQAEATAKYNQTLYDRDAILAEQQAETVQEKVKLELSNFRQQIKTIQSSVTQGYAMRGVEISEGTPLKILEKNFKDAKDDEYIIQYNADVESANLRNQADQSSYQGRAEVQMAKYTKLGKKYEAFGTLLGGSAKAGSVLI